MKRVLTFLAIMLLPLSVMAMTPVSDQTLSDVTGQAGVNINADIAMDISIGTIAWGDEDGITSAANPGWATVEDGGYVGIAGFDITNLRIKAREHDTYGAGYTEIVTGVEPESVTLNPGGTYLAPYFLKPITIDVATGPKNGVNATFVRFGLGSLQITMDSLDFDVRLGTMPAAWGGMGSVGAGMLGKVSIGALGVYINPISFVDIWADATCGVNMELNVVIDEFQIDYVSWGDIDGQINMGLGAGNGMSWMADSAAGYVGLADLVINGPITVAGQLAIDVNTTALGIYASHGTTTVVHIGFGSGLSTIPDVSADGLEVNVTGPITAVVKLDSVAALDNAGTGVLGDIYISGFGLDIYGGSWVDIWAH